MADKDPNTDDLRAQAALLLSQARAQAGDVQRALSMASGNPALQARLGALAAHLAGIDSELSNALGSSSFPLHMADLVALQGVVQSGEASALVNEATAQAGGAEMGTTATAAQVAEVNQASADTRQEAQSLSRDLFEGKIFDRYLHFSSAEDEAEFRKREADAKRYIHDQLALGTPTGNLNAGGGELGYMLDAHAHGAGASPEFQRRWDALVAKTERQHAAMRAAGQSTAEYDRNLDTSVRRFLKDEGHLSVAEIDKRLSGGVNPLEVVKPYIGSDKSSQMLAVQTEHSARIHEAEPALTTRRDESAGVERARTPLSVTVADLGAQLKAGGVKDSDAAEATPAHGLGVAKQASKQDQAVGSQR